MKVSCIIPSYNAEKYIKETILSILNQTYAIDEIIVVDDFSSDCSRKIVRDIIIKHPQVTLIEQKENLGVSAARNKGLEIAKNEWVLMMDSDDLAHPELLKKEIDLLQRNKKILPTPVCIYPAYIQIDSEGKLIENSEFRGVQMSFKELLGSLFIRNYIVTSSGLLINKKAVLEIGGYNKNIVISEDVELYLRLAQKGTFLYLDELLIYYRRHVSNATSNINKVTNASLNLLNYYSLDEVRESIMCRNNSKQKNLLDFVTVLYQYRKYDEGFRYLAEINDKDLVPSKLFLLAIYYIENEKWIKASEALDELLGIDSRHGAALNNRAVLYAMNGELKIANKLFERAIELFPGYMDACNNLGYLHKGIKEYTFTKRELRKNLLRYS